jgi:hypothetical protein
MPTQVLFSSDSFSAIVYAPAQVNMTPAKQMAIECGLLLETYVG